MGTQAEQEVEGTGPVVVDFQDLAQAATAAPTQTDPSAVKLEGDNIPEALRGKTLADVLSLQEELQRGLQASRDTIDSLRNASEALQVARQQPAAQPQPLAPAPQPELTKEQLKEMYERDPFEYNQYVLSQMEKKFDQQISNKFAPLASTTASVGEAQARTKYAEEFAVLGSEINQVLNQIQDKSALAQPGAWDEVMYYIRGRHMDKLLTARQQKADAAALAEARKREAAGAGSVNDGIRRASGRQKIGELTPKMKEAAKVLGMTEDDYRQYYFD